jgi:hypothetical protein
MFFICADLWIGLVVPFMRAVNSGFKKSICPDQDVAITGLLTSENSNKGLPNPSPLVRDIMDLTLG